MIKKRKHQGLTDQELDAILKRAKIPPWPVSDVDFKKRLIQRIKNSQSEHNQTKAHVGDSA